jgi:hypothetical protein
LRRKINGPTETDSAGLNAERADPVSRKAFDLIQHPSRTALAVGCTTGALDQLLLAKYSACQLGTAYINRESVHTE